MMLIYFLNGLSFGGLGLAAFFQYRRGGNFSLHHQLPWLALFGLACGISSWIEMFLVTADPQVVTILSTLRTVSQPISGLFLLIFGWRVLNHLTPLPNWTMIIPVLLIVPIAYVVAYASTTFITPSPIEIPIDIWSRYLFYLPGSLMAGSGFLRQWILQKKLGYADIANLMFGAGLAFLFEAFVMGLVVPAAPYGPASYYNYDRSILTAFASEHIASNRPYGLMPWLDDSSVYAATGLPIQFWRMISSFAVTFFVVRGLDVFETVQRREMKILEFERNQAQQRAFEIQIAARQTAENWTNTLVNINRKIVQLDHADSILLTIIENAKTLLHSDYIGLGILTEDRSQLNLRYFSDPTGPQTVTGDVPVRNRLILEAFHALRSYRSNGRETAQAMEGICVGCNQSLRSLAVVNLKLDTTPIGALWLANTAGRTYSETDLVWLESMADQVVLTIQHNLMMAQLQSLSVIEERGRIARDMHDGVAQVLGYLNVQLQVLEALWKQEKKADFEQELIQMREAIQSANADVRESILSLRTTLANDKGAVAAMADYIQEFGLQTGTDIRFTNQIEGELDLSSIVEVQLVCILQEALTNVRKHARASRVEVILTKDYQAEGQSKFISMQVRDDGIGFESQELKGHYGLKTMAERANSAKGTLHVHSVPGHGTTVLCALPCLATEKLVSSIPVIELGSHGEE